jgi:proton glutamate symport protein
VSFALGAAEAVSFVFLTLVKSLLAPLLFGLIVGSLGRASKSSGLGRIGLRSILYFEGITTVALLVGWAAMVIFEPGRGLGGTAPGKEVASGMSLSTALVNAFPASGVESMAKNDVLPMILFFGLMGLAARAVGKKGEGLVDFADSLLAVSNGYAGIVMRLAPYGMVAAVLVTLLGQGMKAIAELGKFVLAAVLAQLFMGVVIYGLVALLARVPLGRFFRSVRGALAIAFTTTSSAAALPKALEGMEQYGIRKELLGVVMPLGLSFNLAGSNIQLMMGVIFAAQVAGIGLDLGQMLMVLLTLKLAAKGVAGIPRANFVILSASLPMFGLPLGSLPLLLAVDGIIDMVRTPVNVLGNCLAPAVIARWEGEALAEESGQA